MFKNKRFFYYLLVLHSQLGSFLFISPTSILEKKILPLSKRLESRHNGGLVKGSPQIIQCGGVVKVSGWPLLCQHTIVYWSIQYVNRSEINAFPTSAWGKLSACK